MDKVPKPASWPLFFIPAVVILALQAAAPHFITVRERQFPAPSIEKLPYEIGRWHARGDEMLDRSVTEYLKPDEYLLRNYVDPSAGSEVNLFVAYFKSLENSWGPHSPAVCLPGSGWLVRSQEEINIDVPGAGKQIPANKFILEKAGETILVFYWYQNDRRVWAEEYLPKLKLLDDWVRFHRSDVSLVRLISPVRQASVTDEPVRLADFARAMFPLLSERFAATN